MYGCLELPISSEKTGAVGGEEGGSLEYKWSSEEEEEEYVDDVSTREMVRFRFMVVSRRASTSLNRRLSCPF